MNCRDLYLPERWPETESSPDNGVEDSMLSRPETITAGLVLLLNAYRCCACQYLANCIVNHCRTLKNHPDADPLLRQLAAHLETEWQALALPAGSHRHQENRHV